MKKLSIIPAVTFAVLCIALTASAQTTPTVPGSYPANKANRVAKRQTNAATTKAAATAQVNTRTATAQENKANVQAATADGVVTKEEAAAVHTANTTNRTTAKTANATVRQEAGQSRTNLRRTTYKTNKANRGN